VAALKSRQGAAGLARGALSDHPKNVYIRNEPNPEKNGQISIHWLKRDTKVFNGHTCLDECRIIKVLSLTLQYRDGFPKAHFSVGYQLTFISHHRETQVVFAHEKTY
jgi:hypothetical protein